MVDTLVTKMIPWSSKWTHITNMSSIPVHGILFRMVIQFPLMSLTCPRQSKDTARSGGTNFLKSHIGGRATKTNASRGVGDHDDCRPRGVGKPPMEGFHSTIAAIQEFAAGFYNQRWERRGFVSRWEDGIQDAT